MLQCDRTLTQNDYKYRQTFLATMSYKQEESFMNIQKPTVQIPVFPSKQVSIADFGAVADGVTMNTQAINNAIDAVSAAGGGTVLIPAGY